MKKRLRPSKDFIANRMRDGRKSVLGFYTFAYPFKEKNRKQSNKVLFHLRLLYNFNCIVFLSFFFCDICMLRKATQRSEFITEFGTRTKEGIF